MAFVCVASVGVTVAIRKVMSLRVVMLVLVTQVCCRLIGVLVTLMAMVILDRLNCLLN